MSDASGNAPLSPASEASRREPVMAALPRKKHFRELAERDALEEASPEERELLRRSRALLSERLESGEITDEEEALLSDIGNFLRE